MTRRPSRDELADSATVEVRCQRCARQLLVYGQTACYEGSDDEVSVTMVDPWWRGRTAERTWGPNGWRFRLPCRCGGRAVVLETTLHQQCRLGERTVLHL